MLRAVAATAASTKLWCRRRNAAVLLLHMHALVASRPHAILAAALRGMLLHTAHSANTTPSHLHTTTALSSQAQLPMLMAFAVSQLPESALHQQLQQETGA
jgi:hypothetical protein